MYLLTLCHTAGAAVGMWCLGELLSGVSTVRVFLSSEEKADLSQVSTQLLVGFSCIARYCVCIDLPVP